MGIDGRDQDGRIVDDVSYKLKTYMLFLCSFLVSIVGGLLLVYWRIKYHPSNRQLWMVPFGLVMFATPLLVWLISIASDVFCPKEQQLGRSEPSSPASHFVHDPER